MRRGISKITAQIILHPLSIINCIINVNTTGQFGSYMNASIFIAVNSI